MLPLIMLTLLDDTQSFLTHRAQLNKANFNDDKQYVKVRHLFDKNKVKKVLVSKSNYGQNELQISTFLNE